MVIGAYCVAGFAVVSLVSSIVAMFVSWGGFTSNAVSVLNDIFAYYYPVAQLDTEWDNAKVGPSLICLYIAVGFGLVSVMVVLLLEKTNCIGCHNATSRRYHADNSPVLLEVEGQTANSENSTIQAYPEIGMGAASASYRV